MKNKDDKDFDTSDWDGHLEKESDDLSEEETEYEELDFEGQPYVEQPRVRQREDTEGWEDDWEDEWEDEPKPMKPVTMIFVFVGLVILAALICAVLWHFTHGDKDTDGQASQAAIGAEQLAGTQGTDHVEESDLTVGSATDSAAASEATATPEPTAAAETTAMPEPAATPEATETPEPTAKPEATTTPVPTATPDAVQTPGSENTAVQEPVSGNETMVFTEVQETVTVKDVINLRSLPSTADADNIVTQAQNGEVLSRTGINNDTGWSRIDYNGQTLYAVSQYLTTDLSYKTPVKTENPNRVSTKDGRVIIFTDCDDNISPKEYVNLRLEPSTSEGNSTVHCQLNYGEVAHRTGYSADSGWSRVEYDGKVLYVVTSMVYVVTEQ